MKNPLSTSAARNLVESSLGSNFAYCQFRVGSAAKEEGGWESRRPIYLGCLLGRNQIEVFLRHFEGHFPPSPHFSGQERGKVVQLVNSRSECTFPLSSLVVRGRVPSSPTEQRKVKRGVTHSEERRQKKIPLGRFGILPPSSGAQLLPPSVRHFCCRDDRFVHRVSSL